MAWLHQTGDESSKDYNASPEFDGNFKNSTLLPTPACPTWRRILGVTKGGKHQTWKVMACHHQLIQLAHDADVERLCANVQWASLLESIMED
eukprot:COSAG06_NODE_2398_length_6956_cov_2.091877_1_plen_92_part_00